MKKILVFLMIGITYSCKTEPQAIQYGKDNCEFCKMTVMDSKYGAELVTTKGKVFKFDDLSCLVKYMKVSQTNDTDYSHIVFNAVDQPEKLIKFDEAIFVSSPELRSPMLGKIGVFTSVSEAKKYLDSDSLASKTSWEEVKSNLE